MAVGCMKSTRVGTPTLAVEVNARSEQVFNPRRRYCRRPGPPIGNPSHIVQLRHA